jgi:hypothetical protein
VLQLGHSFAWQPAAPSENTQSRIGIASAYRCSAVFALQSLSSGTNIRGANHHISVVLIQASESMGHNPPANPHDATDNFATIFVGGQEPSKNRSVAASHRQDVNILCPFANKPKFLALVGSERDA